MASNQIVTLTVANFESFIQSADKPVLVDFFGPICSPCKTFEPVFEQVSDEVDAFVFAKLDASEDVKFSFKYGVRTVPMVKLFRKNSVPEMVSAGSINIEDFRAKVLSLV